MPMFVGMKLARAEFIVETELPNPHIIVVKVTNASAPPGTVCGQTPLPGTRIAPGSQITLEVS